jgi:hypothetical protein
MAGALVVNWQPTIEVDQQQSCSFFHAVPFERVPQLYWKLRRCVLPETPKAMRCIGLA